MRVLIVLMLLSLSHQSHAFAQGSWCQRFDDFTEVLVLQDQGDLEIFVVGNESGENHGYQTGYLSRGASGAFIEVAGQQYALADVGIRRQLQSGFREQLVLRFADGSVDRYQRCSIERRQVFGRPSVTILK